MLAVLVAMSLAVVTTVVVIGARHQANGPAAPVAPRTTVTQTPSAPATTATPTPSLTGATPTNTKTVGAMDSLAAFFTAASTLDTQLRSAAVAINSAGPPWTDVSTALAGKVRAADLRPVGAKIPAGLPDGLRSAVVLVYSDLSSRHHAMSSFASTAVTHDRTTAELLRELGNGHVAAARFARDLATAKALASEGAAIQPVPRDSRQAAEVLLLVRYVDTGNGGCDSHGGFVVTKAPRITWHHESYRDGTIGGVGFTAVLDSTGGWQINLLAC